MYLHTTQDSQEASVTDTATSTSINKYTYNSKTDTIDLYPLLLHNYGLVCSLYNIRNGCSMEWQEINQDKVNLYEDTSGSRIERIHLQCKNSNVACDMPL